MAGINEGQGKLVFGLDIGTRSIVGIVGYVGGDGHFHVCAEYSKEHETRSMLDGQIHDIGKVGETISAVRRELERRLKIKLTDVCIAAAGRVLRTVTTKVENAFDGDREVTDEDVYELSNMGVEKAYDEFREADDSGMKFYCVGYTVIRYYMNGYQIGNLVGHKAKSIGLDMIATFLPDDVVDGLYKAVELAGLRVVNLTLEPIAAIRVAIPEKYRLLNMALVDVGAGTSDICITKEGTIVAYGMIPIAGDSLTDQIVQHCLVDFETAEKIKRDYTADKDIVFDDIMGLPQTIERDEIEELLAEPIDRMTLAVSDDIKQLNGGKPVSAVFVVGGGGTVKGYTKALADHLGIVKERVAVRGEEVLKDIIFDEEDSVKNSLMVTPIGIALSYYEHANNFIYVEFNKTQIKLYDNGTLTVADAAMMARFDNSDLFPKRGRAINFVVNGRKRIIRGEQGEPAVIRVNGETADLNTQIHANDRIEIIPSTGGADAVAELGKLFELTQPLHITVNGMSLALPKTATVNGVLQNEFYNIKENDDIVINNYYTVEEISKLADVELSGTILVNDIPANVDTKVYENFTVTLNGDNSATESDTVSGVQAEVEAAKKQSDAPARKGYSITLTVNGSEITLSGKDNYVFVDVFDHIDFDLSASRGRNIVALLNGVKAEYMEELRGGDEVEIRWEEK